MVPGLTCEDFDWSPGRRVRVLIGPAVPLGRTWRSKPLAILIAVVCDHSAFAARVNQFVPDRVGQWLGMKGVRSGSRGR